MSKAVMISIRPRWCELIANGEKTMEVRKTRPKLETPFKVYVYCSKPRFEHEDFFALVGKQGFHGGGKVIGEFVCDRIDAIKKRGIPENFDFCYLSLNEWGNDDIEVEIRDIAESRIPKDALNEYGQNVPVLYAWHISDLIIYDKPRKLDEFERPYECDECTAQWASECNACHKELKIKRPPQSWFYVEELRT